MSISKKSGSASGKNPGGQYRGDEYPKRDPNRCPTHPGAILRDIVLPALELPKSKVAHHLGISRQTLYDILAERQPVTSQMAVRIGKLLGNGPNLWLNMQSAYDLWHAKRDVDVSGIPTFKELEPSKPLRQARSGGVAGAVTR